ncbi:hypothetical protein HPG69_005669, partial [Diceros bicornis minor]
TIIPTFHNSTFPTFILTGVPGLEWAHVWISIPFCCLYFTALSGNTLILGIILIITITKSSLHEPMYNFLSMLSATDLGLCISTLVTILDVYWFSARQISFHACVAQTFFIQLFTTILNIASPEEQHKAFSTCISHIGAVAIFYIPSLACALSTDLVMNPIIYSVKTKLIPEALKKVLFPKGSKV